MVYREEKVQRSDEESAISLQAEELIFPVFATIPKIKSRNKKFPLPMPLSP